MIGDCWLRCTSEQPRRDRDPGQLPKMKRTHVKIYEIVGDQKHGPFSGPVCSKTREAAAAFRPRNRNTQKGPASEKQTNSGSPLSDPNALSVVREAMACR